MRCLGTAARRNAPAALSGGLWTGVTSSSLRNNSLQQQPQLQCRTSMTSRIACSVASESGSLSGIGARSPPYRLHKPLQESRNPCMGLFLSRSFSRAAHLSSFISFFVRSQSPFLRPDPPQRQAVAHRSCQGWSPLRRPPTGLGLDSSEHGGTIECSRAGSAR